MRNSIKRFSKCRHTTYPHAPRDLDAVALQLADISIQTEENTVNIIPIKLADDLHDDFDRMAVDTGFDLRFASEPGQSEHFAPFEELTSEGRIQPVMDFPAALSSDNRQSAANQPSIDNPDNSHPAAQPTNHSIDDAHGKEFAAAAMGGAHLSGRADVKTPRPHELRVGTKIEGLPASNWPRANNAQASPYLSRLIVLLICALLIGAGVLGYMMLEIKTELEQLNGQLGNVTRRTGS